MNAELPPFSCTYTPNLPEFLAELNCSVMLTTYSDNKLIAISSNGEQLVQLPRNFERPMGMALKGDQLALATMSEVCYFSTDPELARTYPNKPNHYDALFVPRIVNYTGNLNIHDLSWGREGLMAVNTRYSCIMKMDERYNFIPTWKPPFIDELQGIDACHLNGMAMVDGEPRYATTFSKHTNPEGWRGHQKESGTMIDVQTSEIIAEGLAMPHSPRVYDGKLFVLFSATGELIHVEPDGHCEVVYKTPTFVRGMDRIGDYLFIGTSKLRDTHILHDMPLAKHESTYVGMLIIQLSTGKMIGQLQYLNSCREVYDILVLPNLRMPGILNTEKAVFRNAMSFPGGTGWKNTRKDQESVNLKLANEKKTQ